MWRRVVGALGAVLVAVLLAGCGVRLDTPPPEVPSADTVEQVRQDAARTSADLYAMARSAQGTAQDDAELNRVLIAVETAADEHHAALGGVWEPWPGAGPEATAYPESDDAATTPAPEGSPADVLDLLEASAVDAHADAVAHTGEVGQMLGSVALSRTYLAADLAGALSTQADRIPSEPLPVPEPGGVAPETSRALDAARYALEVAAARSSGDQRATAAGRAEHLAEIAGAVAPEEDQREVAYDVSGVAEAEAPERALAAAAELDVVRAYVALLAADGADREAALAAATHAAGLARSWGASLPALPGLS